VVEGRASPPGADVAGPWRRLPIAEGGGARMNCGGGAKAVRRWTEAVGMDGGCEDEAIRSRPPCSFRAWRTPASRRTCGMCGRVRVLPEPQSSRRAARVQPPGRRYGRQQPRTRSFPPKRVAIPPSQIGGWRAADRTVCFTFEGVRGGRAALFARSAVKMRVAGTSS
jgi:hypothetical protein